MRRAEILIPSNIVEGSGRKNTKEFVQFLYFAKGSLLELVTQVVVANKLGFIAEVKALMNLSQIIRNMLIKLIAMLEIK